MLASAPNSIAAAQRLLPALELELLLAMLLQLYGHGGGALHQGCHDGVVPQYLGVGVKEVVANFIYAEAVSDKPTTFVTASALFRSLGAGAGRGVLVGGGTPEPLAVQSRSIGVVPLGVAPRHTERRARAEAEHGGLQKSPLCRALAKSVKPSMQDMCTSPPSKK
jgi:hypothetical protein